MLLVLRWTLSTEIEKGKLMLTCVSVQTKITRKEKGKDTLNVIKVHVKIIYEAIYNNNNNNNNNNNKSRKQMFDVINT